MPHLRTKNLYSVESRMSEVEGSSISRMNVLSGPEVNLKTHYSDLAHININRLRKQTMVLENERKKLSEFFIQPTKQMLLQDATSLIHMEEYLNSMDTCVNQNDSEITTKTEKKSHHSKEVFQSRKKRVE